MLSLPQIPLRFCPSKETLAVLNGRQWICSYSGGKDSTALVTWIEWLRRIGMVKCDTPRLVMSDTGVEYPFLRVIADKLMAALSATGWQCEVVTPKINERLYNRIFGVGNTPIHPGGRKMRWCTRSTKIDPMKRFSRKVADDVIQLSGVRWGESANRDGKLKSGGCAAGGECGLPDPGEGVFGPIITWKTCKVVEWLSGEAGDDVSNVIADLLPIMCKLVDVYEVKRGQEDLFGELTAVQALRFGCVGCPAITRERVIAGSAGREHPNWMHLRRIQAELWPALYLRKNRCCHMRTKPAKKPKNPSVGDQSPTLGFGPLRMTARKYYFAELLDIQEKAGVTLVTPEDIAFIHDCWERKVYPRGWSEADELTVPPDETLYAGMT